MQEYMFFQALFNGYFKDLYSFYKVIPNINADDRGVISFDKIYIVYENLLNKDVEKPTMSNCQLEVYINEDFYMIERKLLDIKSKIIDKEPHSTFPYILTEDPAGLKVKINFTNERSASSFKIPYNGTLENIDTFYTALDIDCKHGVITLENFKIEYYSKKEEIQICSDDFEVVLCPDDKSPVIEKIVKENGGIVISSENTIMGELIVAKDPAKLVILFYPEPSEEHSMFG